MTSGDIGPTDLFIDDASGLIFCGRVTPRRPETVNRIEQAKRSPSLATFDKLYRAIEAEQAARAAPKTPAVHKRKAKK